MNPIPIGPSFSLAHDLVRQHNLAKLFQNLRFDVGWVVGDGLDCFGQGGEGELAAIQRQILRVKERTQRRRKF